MEEIKKDKIERILGIYSKLIEGKCVNKTEEAVRYGVNTRSIQRDIDDIRAFLASDTETKGFINEISYDHAEKGYRLEQSTKSTLSNSEVLAISKILLDSRAFTKGEMDQMLKSLISCCVPPECQSVVTELIRNEDFHYVEPRHKTIFIDKLWDIGQAILNNQYIEIKYQGIQGSSVKTRKLKPLAIMFSEFYFYLAAFIDSDKVRENFNVLNDAFPTIYRVDRIQDLKVLHEKYHVPYKDRFEEGEFRKRIQFMYGGKLRRVRFKYTGYSVEAVLDRLPTAKIEKEEAGCYYITAEVFGDGIDMWLRSQGGVVKIISS